MPLNRLKPSRSMAGGSARAMATALRADGRRRRLAVYTGLVLTTAGGTWALAGSAQAGLGVAVMTLAGITLYRARRDDDAARWRRGAVGEQRTARILQPLIRRGYTVLHDRAIGVHDRANIDHLVIGPTGVIVVDSKNWNKRTMIKGRRGRIWVGRTPGAKVIAATAVERSRATRILTGELGEPVRVAAALAVHGAKLPYWRSPEIEGIPLLRARSIRRWITRRPTVYDPATVARLAAIAERCFPPYEQQPTR